MPKTPFRHNSSNLGKLAWSSDRAGDNSNIPHSSKDSVSLGAKSRPGPYSRTSLKENYCVEGSRAAIEPDPDTKSSGTVNSRSIWDRARVAHAEHFVESLYGNDEDKIPPFQLHGVAWWDEKHKEV